LFENKTSEYWNSSYLFGNKSTTHIKTLGSQSINGILINTIVPFLFCYAHHKNNDELKSRAIQLLEEIPPEHNSIVHGWEELGLKMENAYDSQAFLQLKKQYCDEKKCLRCRIGHKVLTLI